MAAFHNKCGLGIALYNENRVAIRGNAQYFEQALVFGSKALENDVIFEITIDSKYASTDQDKLLEIGVTVLDPDKFCYPVPSTVLCTHKTWLLSGSKIMKNRTCIQEDCGRNINTLIVGDTIGIMRASNNDLTFYVNDNACGGALENMPPKLFVVINLNGSCSAVSTSFVGGPFQRSLDRPEGDEMTYEFLIKNRLYFHKRCGTLVKLSNDDRTAERKCPMDEFNNAVVMTHRPLRDREVFEIRIDRLVDKWSGSIEVGVTTHNPEDLEFPATMTNMRSGTIMMSGCGLLTNGKGTRREYGKHNLDELQEGDTIGMMKRENGDLHYLINGMDQGVAASKLDQPVWGVIDLYGMTIKVTIISRLETAIAIGPAFYLGLLNRPPEPPKPGPANRLLFYTECGLHAIVTNNGVTALRPHATDDFNNGVVLTNRPLEPGELFEVKLERVVSKWAGSIEIGVTTHAPENLEFPFTMTNMTSGTWMMTGNGVMHNRGTLLDRYGSNLDRLKVGDRVGVIRYSDGALKFFINGVDQGVACTSVPANIFGVIDLYGQAAQASIVSANSPDSIHSSISFNTLHGGDLCFNEIHGNNLRLNQTRTVATKLVESHASDNCLMFSSRPLRECEMFQFKIDAIGERYKKKIIVGVVGFPLDKVKLPNSIYDFSEDSAYYLDGSSLFKNRRRSSEHYQLNLENVTVGSLIGIMRQADRSVHFFLDGMDQGAAWHVKDLNIYAIIDLCGNCSQVTMSAPKSRGLFGNSENSLMMLTAGLQSSPATKTTFSEYCGTNIKLNRDCTVAKVTNSQKQSNLVFSASLLGPGEYFEVEVVNVDPNIFGSMRVGVTDVNILNAHVNQCLPSSINDLSVGTMYIEGRRVHIVGSNLLNIVSPNIDHLQVKDRLCLRRVRTSNCIALQVNGEEVGIVFTNIPDKVFVVFELSGPQIGLTVVSRVRPLEAMEVSDASLHLIDSIGPIPDDDECSLATFADILDCMNSGYKRLYHFKTNEDNNLKIEAAGRTAKRVRGYNRAIVGVDKPIQRGQSFKFKIVKLNKYWNSGLMLGIGLYPLPADLPGSAAEFKQGYMVVTSDSVCLDGVKNHSVYGMLLDCISEGSIICMNFLETGELQIVIDGINLGTISRIMPRVENIYPFVDLYGSCEQVMLNPDEPNQLPEEEESEIAQVHDIDLPCMDNADVPQQGEKADLECFEKENVDHCLKTNDPRPSMSTSKKISTIISENECRNQMIQNLSINVSPTVANQVKNEEIKKRTIMENSIEVQKKIKILNLNKNLMLRSCPNLSPEEEYGNSGGQPQSRSLNASDAGEDSNWATCLATTDFCSTFAYMQSDEFKGEQQSKDSSDSTEKVSGCTQSIDAEKGEPSQVTVSFTNNAFVDADLTGIDMRPIESAHGCSYYIRVLNFGNSLRLPQLFTPLYPTCYCRDCHPQESVYQGWVRFCIEEPATAAVSTQEDDNNETDNIPKNNQPGVNSNFLIPNLHLIECPPLAKGRPDYMFSLFTQNLIDAINKAMALNIQPEPLIPMLYWNPGVARCKLILLFGTVIPPGIVATHLTVTPPVDVCTELAVQMRCSEIPIWSMGEVVFEIAQVPDSGDIENVDFQPSWRIVSMLVRITDGTEECFFPENKE